MAEESNVNTISRFLINNIPYVCKDEVARSAISELNQFEYKVANQPEDVPLDVAFRIDGASEGLLGTLMASADTEHIIYLVPANDRTEMNVYYEYLTVKTGTGESANYKWEKIGDTKVDLSDYITITQANATYATIANPQFTGNLSLNNTAVQEPDLQRLRSQRLILDFTDETSLAQCSVIRESIPEENDDGTYSFPNTIWKIGNTKYDSFQTGDKIIIKTISDIVNQDYFYGLHFRFGDSDTYFPVLLNNGDNSSWLDFWQLYPWPHRNSISFLNQTIEFIYDSDLVINGYHPAYPVYKSSTSSSSYSKAWRERRKSGEIHKGGFRISSILNTDSRSHHLFINGRTEFIRRNYGTYADWNSDTNSLEDIEKTHPVLYFTNKVVGKPVIGTKVTLVQFHASADDAYTAIQNYGFLLSISDDGETPITNAYPIILDTAKYPNDIADLLATKQQDNNFFIELTLFETELDNPIIYYPPEGSVDPVEYGWYTDPETGEQWTEAVRYWKVTNCSSLNGTGCLPRENPVISGSISMGRKADSTIGENTVAVGMYVVASEQCAHAEGFQTTASGHNSHAEGVQTTASGQSSHAEGVQTTASGQSSHAEGNGADSITLGEKDDSGNDISYASGAYGEASHSEGFHTHAGGASAHSEGQETVALGPVTHTEGIHTIAKGYGSHAEGITTKATNSGAHAEGSNTTASGDRAHAEGHATTASGAYSHAEGYYTTAFGMHSHAEGYGDSSFSKDGVTYTPGARGIADHSEGYQTFAHSGSDGGAHAEGYQTIASEQASHAEGYVTKASAPYTHAEGITTKATNSGAHAEGSGTTASGQYSHAEGGGTTAAGSSSHAEGSGTVASSDSAHAEGQGTKAHASGSHAEGTSTSASGTSSHAEGTGTSAAGSSSHAEGYRSTASHQYSHAEGYCTTTSATAAHAEGFGTSAYGLASHAEGTGTIATGESIHVSGKYNSVNANDDSDLAFVIGNGTSDSERSNALTLDWNGNLSLAGGIKLGQTMLTEELLIRLLSLLPADTSETTSEG